MECAQLVELLVYAVAYDSSLCYEEWCVGAYLPLYALSHLCACLELVGGGYEGGVVCLAACCAQDVDGVEGLGELAQLAWVDSVDGDFGYDALEVADAAQLFVHCLAELWRAEVVLDGVETVVYLAAVFQGECHPSSQQPSSHGCLCVVYDAEQ